MMLYIFGAVAGVLAMAVLAAWLVPQAERRPLDDTARAELETEGHRFVRLSGGYTHFEGTGPPDGCPVVLVHGFSSPMFIWDHQVAALAGAGFHVLRYDLYGRGYSDRPAGCYDEDRFDRQLLDLLDSQHLHGPVDLIGLSMGGAIAVHFTDRHPERVRRLGLIAPAGMMSLPAASKLLLVPGLGWWILRVFGDGIITRQMPRGLAGDTDCLHRFVSAYEQQLRFRGYKRSLQNSMKNYDLAHMDPVYRRVGQQRGRTGILLWGTADTVVDYGLHERVRGYIPWLTFHPVPGGGHATNYADASQVNPALVAFLRQT
ncbi:MAG: alpha/beta fold hydrolase [Candidatus Hydrogenedentota bacterium]